MHKKPMKTTLGRNSTQWLMTLAAEDQGRHGADKEEEIQWDTGRLDLQCPIATICELLHPVAATTMRGRTLLFNEYSRRSFRIRTFNFIPPMTVARLVAPPHIRIYTITFSSNLRLYKPSSCRGEHSTELVYHHLWSMACDASFAPLLP